MVKIKVFSETGKTIGRAKTLAEARKKAAMSKFKKGFILRTTTRGTQVIDFVKKRKKR